MIRYLHNTSNLGYQKNVLTAAEAAKGAMIMLVGDDDLLLPGTVARYLLALDQYPDVLGILCNGVQISDKADDITFYIRNFPRDTLFTNDDRYRRFWVNATFITGLAMKSDVLRTYWPTDLIYPQLKALAVGLGESPLLGLEHFGYAARVHSGQLGNQVLQGQEKQSILHVFGELPRILTEEGFSPERIDQICAPFLMRVYSGMIMNRHIEQGRAAAFRTLRLGLETYPPLRKFGRVSILRMIAMFPRWPLQVTKETVRRIHLLKNRHLISDETRDIAMAVDRSAFGARNCSICHSALVGTRLTDVRDYRYGTPGTFRILRCQTCGIGYTDPVPVNLGIHYPSNYSAHTRILDSPIRTKMYELVSSRSKDIRARAVRGAVRQVITLLPEPQGDLQLLDVGCGNGRTLRELRGVGWSVVGVELAEAHRAGLDVTLGSFPEISFDRQFDVIRMNHVLEHTSTPMIWLEHAFKNLKPGGRLYIGVPNTRGFTNRVFRRYALQLDVPRHLCHFDQKSLRRLGEAAGFIVETGRWRSIHSDYVAKSFAHSLLYSSWGKRFHLTRLGQYFSHINIYKSPFLLLSISLDALHIGDNLEMTARKPDREVSR